jgi:hypothetical protein
MISQMATQVTDVDKVALWAGLIASVAGIVLSIVAIVFAVLGSLRLEKVTDATIRSLQKIESDVGYVHEQTSGLLKAGWEKMLTSVSSDKQGFASMPQVDVKGIAAGIASEIRSAVEDLKEHSAQENPETKGAWKELEETIKDMQSTLAHMSATSSDEGKVSDLDQQFAGLPPEARELAYQVRGGHLSAGEYKMLKSGPLGDAVHALRPSGTLVPVLGYAGEGRKKERAYWFSSRGLLPTVLLSRPDDTELERAVGTELSRVGYYQREPR